ncbi:hypothetical protein VTI28DRAFT_5240 [Corynascus sepedonium]
MARHRRGHYDMDNPPGGKAHPEFGWSQEPGPPDAFDDPSAIEPRHLLMSGWHARTRTEMLRDISINLQGALEHECQDSDCKAVET